MGTTNGFSSRAALVGAATAVAAVLGVAGAAWACTNAATVSVAPGEGRPGSTVTVEGDRFDGTVEIRWSAGDRLLARTSGPSFSVAVQIPADAAPGTTYYIVGTGRMADGKVLGKNQAPFHIPGTSGSTGTDTEPSGDRKTSGTLTRPSGSSDPQPEPTEASSPSSADATTSPSPSADGPSPAPAAGEAEESGVAGRAPRPAGDTSQAGAARRSVSAATSKSAPAPAVGTRAAAEQPAAANAPTVVDEEAQPAVAPSGRSVNADVWSGFQTGADAARGPSLLAQPPASGGGSHLGAGVALLSVGLLALTLGVAGAAATRRRAVRVAHRR